MGTGMRLPSFPRVGLVIRSFPRGPQPSLFPMLETHHQALLPSIAPTTLERLGPHLAVVPPQGRRNSTCGGSAFHKLSPTRPLRVPSLEGETGLIFVIHPVFLSSPFFSLFSCNSTQPNPTVFISTHRRSTLQKAPHLHPEHAARTRHQIRPAETTIVSEGTSCL